MSMLLLKIIEFPNDEVVELDDLTQSGLCEVLNMAEELIKEVESKMTMEDD